MPNSNCTASSVQFSRQGRQTIEVNFQGGELTSDGGMLLLQRFDQKIGLTQAAGAVLSFIKCVERVMHPSFRTIFKNKFFGKTIP